MTASETYQRIWQTVAAIPVGQVATYGQIAMLAGFPHQARLVGYALRHATDIVPWHRVINARGRLSFPEHSRHYAEQRQRLINEGVLFDNGAVDLARFRWQPGDPTETAKETVDRLLWLP